jgi:hypothetical protein
MNGSDPRSEPCRFVNACVQEPRFHALLSEGVAGAELALMRANTLGFASRRFSVLGHLFGYSWVSAMAREEDRSEPISSMEAISKHPGPRQRGGYRCR